MKLDFCGKRRRKEFKNVLENILENIHQTDKIETKKQKKLTKQIEEKQAQKRYEEAKNIEKIKINIINKAKKETSKIKLPTLITAKFS